MNRFLVLLFVSLAATQLTPLRVHAEPLGDAPQVELLIQDHEPSTDDRMLGLTLPVLPRQGCSTIATKDLETNYEVKMCDVSDQKGPRTYRFSIQRRTGGAKKPIEQSTDSVTTMQPNKKTTVALIDRGKYAYTHVTATLRMTR